MSKDEQLKAILENMTFEERLRFLIKYARAFGRSRKLNGKNGNGKYREMTAEERRAYNAAAKRRQREKAGAEISN